MIRQAQEQWQFDNLAGQGKPRESLGGSDDPIKQWVKREALFRGLRYWGLEPVEEVVTWFAVDDSD